MLLKSYAENHINLEYVSLSDNIKINNDILEELNDILDQNMLFNKTIEKDEFFASTFVILESEDKEEKDEKESDDDKELSEMDNTELKLEEIKEEENI